MKLVPIILPLVFHSIDLGDAAVNCYQCKTVQAKGTCETAVKCTGDFCLSYEARTVKDSKLIKSYACAPDGVNSQGTSSGKVCQTQKFDLPGKEFFEDKLFMKEMKTCICKGEKCNTSEADETNGGASAESEPEKSSAKRSGQMAFGTLWTTAVYIFISFII